MKKLKGDFPELRTLGQHIALACLDGEVQLIPWQYPDELVSDDMARVDTIAAGVCGADIRFVHGGKHVDGAPSQLILGHSNIGRFEGEYVAPMVHLLPKDLANTAAVQNGNIYQVARTFHAGMGVNGTFASQFVWPREYLVPISEEVMQKAGENSLRPNMPKEAVFVELEHTACVETSIAHFEAEEQRLNGANLEKLRSGEGRIAIVGLGWMGLLLLIALQNRYPGNEFFIVEPNSQRSRRVRSICEESGLQVPTDISCSITQRESSLDVIFLATAADAAAKSAFSLVKKDGHVVLFSGSDNVDTFDPTGLVNLESIHRIGTGLAVNVVDQKGYLLSGSSGYTEKQFHRSVGLVADYAGPISLGITGYIERDSASLCAFDGCIPQYSADNGAAFERIFDRDSEWCDYLAQHLKVIWLNGKLEALC